MVVSLYEVGKYYTLADLGSTSGGFTTINLDVWKSLPEDIRTIMLEVGDEHGSCWVEGQITEVKNLQTSLEKLGVEFIVLPDGAREYWSSLPEVKSIRPNWVKTMEADGLPGKVVMDRWEQILGVAE